MHNYARLDKQMLLPHIERGALVPLLDGWAMSFPGPFLYYPGRRHLPAPLRAFVDFVKAHSADAHSNDQSS